MKITVPVVEDLEDYRNGLVNLISITKEYSCTGYASAEEALAILPALQGDIALVDISLPGISSIELVAKLKLQSPATLCMICTAYDEDEKVFKTLEAGAYGHILKRTLPAGIVSAIAELRNGGSPMSSDVARKVIHFSKSQSRRLR